MQNSAEPTRNRRRWSDFIVNEIGLDGRLAALKLLHLDADNAEAGAQASHSALWLAPQWGYLPVRIRMQESANDSLDLQLQTVPQELRDMSSTQPVTR